MPPSEVGVAELPAANLQFETAKTDQPLAKPEKFIRIDISIS